jgi:hypothetical protein
MMITGAALEPDPEPYEMKLPIFTPCSSKIYCNVIRLYSVTIINDELIYYVSFSIVELLLLLHLNILNTFFWYMHNFTSCLTAEDQVLHPYKTVGKVSFCILFNHLYSPQVDKEFRNQWWVLK